MANNFEKNITTKVMKKVAHHFEANRILSKSIDTTMFRGKFDADSGDTVKLKRPVDFTTVTTATGDITGQKKDIITADVTAYAQPMITVPVEYNLVDKAINMGSDSDRFWNSIARRIVIQFELSVAEFMLKNAGLSYGTPGVGVQKWSDVAGSGAFMESLGVPQDQMWNYMLNPFSRVALADDQRGLGVNSEVKTAHEKAVIASNYAGYDVMTATTLAGYTTGTGADRSGTLSADPNVTYLANKDTMQQTLAVTGFQANLVVAAGEVITIAGRNRLNQATREVITDESGDGILYSAVVAETVTLDGSGAGNIVINGPAIYEATGAYNTVDTAPVSGDVVTLGGAQLKQIKPNLFYHPSAFSVSTIKIPELDSTDTTYTSEDGLVLRCSKYANGDANTNTIRFDLHPVLCCVNPSMAGHGYGTV